MPFRVSLFRPVNLFPLSPNGCLSRCTFFFCFFFSLSLSLSAFRLRRRFNACPGSSCRCLARLFAHALFGFAIDRARRRQPTGHRFRQRQTRFRRLRSDHAGKSSRRWYLQPDKPTHHHRRRERLRNLRGRHNDRRQELHHHRSSRQWLALPFRNLRTHDPKLRHCQSSRTAFARTDSTSTGDDPPGQRHPRPYKLPCAFALSLEGAWGV